MTEPFVLTRTYEPEPDADDQTARRLVRATGRLFDAMRFARGPRGEMLFVSDDLIMGLAFHLARAGADQFDDLAIIKPRAIPDRPGQFTGMVDWVPSSTPDVEPPVVSAQGPVPEAPDLEAMDDRIPWHTQPKIEGDFT